MIAQFIELLFSFIWNTLRSGRPGRKSLKTTHAGAEAATDDVSLGTILRSPFEALGSTTQEPADLFLSAAMLLRHLVLLGGTGVGKTNLLLQIVRWLVKNRQAAVCLLDARGDLVDRVLARLSHDYAPEELKERLLLIDLRTDAFSIPFNILREPGLDPYTRVALILDVLGAQWDIGVQTLQTLRACLLTLALTDTDLSLLEIEPLLVNAPFRQRLLASITDTTLLRFWERFGALAPAQQSQWIEPCLNKVSAWLSRPVLRNMFAQCASISLRQLFDARPDRIILASLAYDELYADAALAGNLLITMLLSAAMRTDKPEAQRQPVYLVIDEFENFTGAGRQFEQAIQEGRRFKLGLCLSHQSSVQVEPKLRSLIKNVVGTQIFYSVGGSEADLLAGEIATDEPKAAVKHRLMNQAVGECMVVQRGRSAVRIRTRHCPDPDVEGGKVEALRLAAFQAFGRPRAEIEAELAAREAGFSGRTPAPHQKAPKTPKTNAAPDAPAVDSSDVNNAAGCTPAPTRKGAQAGPKGHDGQTVLEVREHDDIESPQPRRARRKQDAPKS